MKLPLAHIGMLLHLLREDRRMSILALVASMDAHGYVIRVATYMQMEAGVLSENGEAFLDAYSKAMVLSHEELVLVVTQWAYDLLRRDMGADVSRRILG